MLIIITYFICLCVCLSIFPAKLKATLNQKLYLSNFYFPKDQCVTLNEWTTEQVLQFLSVYQGRMLLCLLGYLQGGRNVGDLRGISHCWCHAYFPWRSIIPLLSYWKFDHVSFSLEIGRNSAHVFLWLLRIIGLLHHIILIIMLM